MRRLLRASIAALSITLAAVGMPMAANEAHAVEHPTYSHHPWPDASKDFKTKGVFTTPNQRTITVHQGATIRSGSGGTCSITLIGDRTGYTAEHCSHGRWTRGTEIFDQSNHRIGRVAAMSRGLDAVKINLDPSVRVDGRWEKRDYNTLNVGEPVHVLGLGQRFNESRVTDRPLMGWNGRPNTVALVSPLNSRPGTSGGAMVDRYNRVIGINVGYLENYTGKYGAYIPWNVVDSELR